jgi:hypothetical protein
MKKLILVFIMLLLLSSCGNQVMVVRGLLEADQYLLNNGPNLSWSLFQDLLSPDTTVTEEDYHNIVEILEERKRSSFVQLDNTIYRFTTNYELVYAAEWVEVDGQLQLKTFDYIKKRD